VSRPVVTPVESAISARYGNGQIPTDEMVHVMPELGRFGWLLPAPARAWRAMTAAALDAGFRLDATGMYRSLADQEALFRQRFTPHLLPPGKWWQARWWRLKPGMATAARPGASNHGKGRSVDAAEETDGDPAPEGLTRGLLAWLEANAVSFGFSWEKGIERSEPWHLVYFLGDAVSPRTLAFERAGHPSTQNPPEVTMFVVATYASADRWLVSTDAGRPVRTRLDPVHAEPFERKTGGLMIVTPAWLDAVQVAA